jgi:hypothetical protein
MSEQSARLDALFTRKRTAKQQQATRPHSRLIGGMVLLVLLYLLGIFFGIVDFRSDASAFIEIIIVLLVR